MSILRTFSAYYPGLGEISGAGFLAFPESIAGSIKVIVYFMGYRLIYQISAIYPLKFVILLRAKPVRKATLGDNIPSVIKHGLCFSQWSCSCYVSIRFTLLSRKSIIFTCTIPSWLISILSSDITYFGDASVILLYAPNSRSIVFSFANRYAT